ncbi:MAG: ABC transporter ATP-binding protein [Thermoplasmata archaeon]
MAEAIVVEDLVKQYPGVRAVDGVGFRVPEGSVFAFLGPNGAGKTTTTEILEGIRARTSGTVRVLGLDPWSEGRELHRHIGVIPQDFRFFDKITPREAIRYYAALFGTRPDPEALLARVQLTEKADARFDTLSGGQKQKLGLALALVNDPKVCFLDEPTTGLDPQARRGIWEVIRSLRRESRTVFLTTHYLEEAELLADRVAIIHHGRIVAEGRPAEIVAAHGGPARLVLEAGPEVAALLRSRFPNPVAVDGARVEVVLGDRDDAIAILDALRSSGLPWGSFSTRRDTLEDVFVHLVGRMDEGTIAAGNGADRPEGRLP